MTHTLTLAVRHQGAVHTMEAHKRELDSLLIQPGVLTGAPDAVAALLSSLADRPCLPLAPSGYGLVVLDLDGKALLSVQDYTDFAVVPWFHPTLPTQMPGTEDTTARLTALQAAGLVVAYEAPVADPSHARLADLRALPRASIDTRTGQHLGRSYEGFFLRVPGTATPEAVVAAAQALQPTPKDTMGLSSPLAQIGFQLFSALTGLSQGPRVGGFTAYIRFPHVSYERFRTHDREEGASLKGRLDELGFVFSDKESALWDDWLDGLESFADEDEDADGEVDANGVGDAATRPDGASTGHARLL